MTLFIPLLQKHTPGNQPVAKEIDRTAFKVRSPSFAGQLPTPMSSNKGNWFLYLTATVKPATGNSSQGFVIGQAASGWVNSGRCTLTPMMRIRPRAEQWNARLVGVEAQQNHDAGFLYYYSSAFGFDETHSPELRDSALKVRRGFRSCSIRRLTGCRLGGEW